MAIVINRGEKAEWLQFGGRGRMLIQPAIGRFEVRKATKIQKLRPRYEDGVKIERTTEVPVEELVCVDPAAREQNWVEIKDRDFPDWFRVWKMQDKNRNSKLEIDNKVIGNLESSLREKIAVNTALEQERAKLAADKAKLEAELAALQKKVSKAASREGGAPGATG